ncbi:MAG: amidohydrolase family protein [Desulfoferrobacter sp.]
MRESFSIFAGWLIDGTGEPSRENMFIRVEHGLIRSVRPARQADMYTHDLINVSNCTLLPALLDCHVHLCMSGTTDEEVRRKQLSFGFEQAGKAIRAHLLDHLSYGTVAVRDGGDYGAHSLRYKKEKLANDGLPISLLSPGKAWRARGRYGRLIGRPPADGKSLAEAVEEKNGETDHIKIANSGVNSLIQFGKETRPQFQEAELAEAIRIGRGRGLKTMVHANGKEPVRAALQSGCHSIEHGFFMGKDNLEWMAERQVFWVPTAYSMKAYADLLGKGSVEAEVARRNLDHQLVQISMARKLDVPIALGTDAGGLGINHGKALSEEIKLLMAAGYPLECSIRAATLDPARLLGLEGELGEIKKGMAATFIVAKGEPNCLPASLCPPERIYIRGRLWQAGSVGSRRD